MSVGFTWIYYTSSTAAFKIIYLIKNFVDAGLGMQGYTLLSGLFKYKC